MTAVTLFVGSLALYFAVDYGIRMFLDYSRDFPTADCVSKAHVEGKDQSNTEANPQTGDHDKKLTVPSPDLDQLSEAGKEHDREGLTKAGRGLDKHGNRKGSVFPKSKRQSKI